MFDQSLNMPLEVNVERPVDDWLLPQTRQHLKSQRGAAVEDFFGGTDSVHSQNFSREWLKLLQSMIRIDKN